MTETSGWLDSHPKFVSNVRLPSSTYRLTVSGRFLSDAGNLNYSPSYFGKICLSLSFVSWRMSDRFFLEAESLTYCLTLFDKFHSHHYMGPAFQIIQTFVKLSRQQKILAQVSCLAILKANSIRGFFEAHYALDVIVAARSRHFMSKEFSGIKHFNSHILDTFDVFKNYLSLWNISLYS